ncbi:hypothetical protein TREES_T100014817 [Tupaia chinensis]|uniref:Uncharacterized protein n=1 Tax=Tupaia chinensis TaxID=246437 RepID=L9KTT1_TUPCH|nr:hypothetical protein TREES_T100014817 [Tupaia chinensis]
MSTEATGPSLSPHPCCWGFQAKRGGQSSRWPCAALEKRERVEGMEERHDQETGFLDLEGMEERHDQEMGFLDLEGMEERHDQETGFLDLEGMEERHDQEMGFLDLPRAHRGRVAWRTATHGEGSPSLSQAPGVGSVNTFYLPVSRGPNLPRSQALKDGKNVTQELRWAQLEFALGSGHAKGEENREKGGQAKRGGQSSRWPCAALEKRERVEGMEERHDQETGFLDLEGMEERHDQEMGTGRHTRHLQKELLASAPKLAAHTMALTPCWELVRLCSDPKESGHLSTLEKGEGVVSTPATHQETAACKDHRVAAEGEVRATGPWTLTFCAVGSQHCEGSQCKERSRSYRGKASPAALAAGPPASRAQLRIAHRSAFTPKAQPGEDQVSAQVAASALGLGSVPVSRANWELSRIPSPSRPQHGLGKWVSSTFPAACQTLRPVPALPAASSVSSRPGEGGDPSILSRAGAEVPTKPQRRVLCASCKVSARA